MWARIEPMLPRQGDRPRRHRADTRRFLAALWRIRTFIRRARPARFEQQDSVFKRFQAAGLFRVFSSVFNGVVGRVRECVCVDGTVVSAHQKAAGAKGGPAARASAVPGEAVTGKIAAVADALGDLVRLVILQAESGARHCGDAGALRGSSLRSFDRGPAVRPD